MIYDPIARRVRAGHPPFEFPGDSDESALMVTSDEDLYNRPHWSGLDGDMLVMHRDFCRDGRKVYELTAAVSDRLASMPAHWPELGARRPETWVLRLPEGIPTSRGAVWTGYYVRFGVQPDGDLFDKGTGEFQRVPVDPILSWLPCGYNRDGIPIAAEARVACLSAGMIEDDPREEERPFGRRICNAVAAILDQRVSQIVAHPKHGRAGREFLRRRLHVATLELSEDGLHTWRTSLIGDADDLGDAGDRKGPGAHLVHEHTCRFWTRADAYPDVPVEIDDDGVPMCRMSTGRRPVALVARRLPVREHVRGTGAVAPRVTRVVPG